VDLPLLKEHVDIRRVTVGRDIDDFPAIRYEGETTIIPVVEEVLVVERRLRLKEEIHITRRREREQHQQNVTLRREEVELERLGTGNEPNTTMLETGGEAPAPKPPAAIQASKTAGGYRRRNKILTGT